MNHVQRPARAVVRRSRQIQGCDYQELAIDSENFDRHDFDRDLLSKLFRNCSQPRGFFNIHATLTMGFPSPTHPSLLPLYYSSSVVSAFPARLVDTDITSHVRQPLGIPNRNGLLQQRVENQNGQSQPPQGSCTSRPSTRSRKRTNIRSPAKEKHERRRKEVLEVLNPILASEQMDSQWILLCWGKTDHCQMIPVKIPHSADDVAVWHEVQRVWYKQKGSWRRNIPFFGVKKVSAVDVRSQRPTDVKRHNTNRLAQVSIAGRNSKSLSDSEFIGSYTEEDIETQKQRLEQKVAEYMPQEFPCSYDPETGRTDCFNDCVSWVGYGLECPEETFHSAERGLRRLNMRQFLALAFSDPSIAKGNDFFADDILLTDKYVY